MAEPTPIQWAELLDAASRFLRAYGTDNEAQALLELAAAIGEVEAMLERQRGRERPEWLDRH